MSCKGVKTWFPPVAFLAGMVMAVQVQAVVFVVDTTSDANLTACTAAAADCSLRGAITQANLTGNVDDIHFNIPMTDAGCNAGSGVCRIVLGSDLPTISKSLNIDGYTQPGATPNTLPAPGANNARLKIEIAGSPSFGFDGVFYPGNSIALELRGLAVFVPSNGMVGRTGSQESRVVVRGNWFGVDAAGQTPDYTAPGSPLFLSSFHHTLLIGGPNPADRNVLAGSGRDFNGQPGGGGNTLRVNSTSSARGRILLQGNLIGLAPDGITPLPLRDAFTIQSGDDGFQTPQIEFLDNRFVRPRRNTGGSFGGALLFHVGRQMNETALIQGNVFGLGVDGSRIGVERDHIEVFLGNSSQVPRILIGGLGVGEGNVFAAAMRHITGASNALGSAVRLPGGEVQTFVEFTGNTLLGNDGQGLDFPHGTAGGGSTLGRTPNDAGDADTGANAMQNFPAIQTFSVSGSSVNVSYRVDSLPANSAYPLRVDFYKALGDEGQVLIDSDVYEETDAQTIKAATLTLPPGVSLSNDDVLVGIATTFSGQSSEFSFDTLTLALGSLPASHPAGLPLEVEVTATATSGPFKPNGVVVLSLDTSPAASCEAELVPAAAPLTSKGTCSLASPQLGNRILTATYDPLRGAFASATGTAVSTTATVVFTDPGPERISFASCRAIALEGRDLLVRVTRPGGLLTNVSVTLEHIAGTATAGVDYTAPATQTLTWAAGDTTPRVVTIPIASDGAVEPVETFRLRLVDPVNTAILPNALMEVSILDGDLQGFRDGFEGDCPQ